jgi:hypothetical protein
MVKNIRVRCCIFVSSINTNIYIMKTMNYLTTILVITTLAFTACQKDNTLQEETSTMFKSHETGEAWKVEADPLTNSPDPFSESTTIEYRLNEPGEVRLSVTGENTSGIMKMVNGYHEAGVYQVVLDGRKLKPGYYVATLSHNGRIIKERMYRIEGTSGGGDPISD